MPDIYPQLSKFYDHFARVNQVAYRARDWNNRYPYETLSPFQGDASLEKYRELTRTLSQIVKDIAKDGLMGDL